MMPAAFTLPAIAAFLAEGTVSAIACEALARIAAWNDPALFITALREDEVLARAAALDAEGAHGRPLFGVPFVVKDNIDVALLPTTAACPAYVYTPERHASSVARLLAAGALLLGKVNLDQFATGLNGTRSPYGTPRNAVAPERIPGGSSSGSASAVAAGIAAFALGTDTAGSGRVPAMAQNIVGLKPSLGLVPTLGVVPACRSLDVVSVFALTAADAAAVLQVIAGPDAEDRYARAAPQGWRAAGAVPPSFRLAVPHDEALVFDSDDNAALHAAAVARAEALGASVVRVDIAPLLAVARRLYDGAWVAERTAGLRDFLAARPDALHPVTRAILDSGFARSAVDAFDDFHAVAEARRIARALFVTVDALMLPTAPGIPDVAAMLADPIGANSRLGTYTNFVNLCDLAGIAVPAGFDRDGVPFGVTLLGPAFSEARLVALGGALHHAAGLSQLGVLRAATPAPAPADPLAPDETALFCIGAHMSGLPLNHQVTAPGGRFIAEARTGACYRLYDLGSRPGLVRVAEGGAAIEGEIWAVPTIAIGALLAQVPAPLGFGRVKLEGGEMLGFLCEAEGAAGARDITASGGWRNWLAR